MSTTASLELRIHSGAHAGASEPLDAQSHVLGAGQECDFVLGDAGLLPQQVRLEMGPEGWRMLRWGEASDLPGDAVTLAPGVLHLAGPLVISIDTPQAPWPPAEQVSALLNLPTAEVEIADDTPAMAIDEVLESAEEPLSEAPVLAAEPQPPRHIHRAVMGSMVALIVGALIWVVLPKTSLKAGNAEASVAATSPKVIGAQTAIDAIILAQGLADRVTTEPDALGKFRVRAALLTDDEYEKLALALSALTPRPALAVTTEQDLQILVGESVARQSAELSTPITARHMGGANFRVEGTLHDSEERNAFLGRLKNDLPALVVLESGLLTPEDLAQRLLDELRGANFAEINGQWTDEHLQMSISLAQADVPNWEQLLARVARKHKVPFNVSLTLQEKAASKKLPRALASLPFHLQSVVSGGTPYVVIDGGVKLLLDGRSQGWRLVSIDPGSVVFEGDHSNRVVVER